MKDKIATRRLALLNLVLMMLSPAAYAVEPGGIVKAPRAQAAAPAGMLPCPLSVPCIAQSQDEAAAIAEPAADDSPTAAESASRGEQFPKSAPRSETLMLPCPLSVPCIATAPALPPLPDSIVSTDSSPEGEAPQPRMGVEHDPSPSAKTHRRARVKITKAVSATALVTPVLQPPVGEVGMAGNKDYAASAQERLAEASRGLTAVDPATLSAQDRPTYQEASNFVSQSRAALQVHDNLAALTLAQKACQLLNDLKPGNASGRR